MDYEVKNISGKILSEKKNEAEPRKKKRKLRRILEVAIINSVLLLYLHFFLV